MKNDFHLRINIHKRRTPESYSHGKYASVSEPGPRTASANGPGTLVRAPSRNGPSLPSALLGLVVAGLAVYFFVFRVKPTPQPGEIPPTHDLPRRPTRTSIPRSPT